MKNHSDYLETLPLTKAVKQKVEDALNLTHQIYKLDVEDIFICEMKNEEGVRNYTSLWLFTKEFCIECKDFLTRNDFDLTPLNDQLSYGSIEFRDFDLNETNEKSFVKIHFSFRLGLSGTIISTEENCKWALKIYKTYVLPNIKK